MNFNEYAVKLLLPSGRVVDRTYSHNNALDRGHCIIVSPKREKMKLHQVRPGQMVRLLDEWRDPGPWVVLKDDAYDSPVRKLTMLRAFDPDGVETVVFLYDPEDDTGCSTAEMSVERIEDYLIVRADLSDYVDDEYPEHETIDVQSLKVGDIVTDYEYGFGIVLSHEEVMDKVPTIVGDPVAPTHLTISGVRYTLDEVREGKVGDYESSDTPWMKYTFFTNEGEVAVNLPASVRLLSSQILNYIPVQNYGFAKDRTISEMGPGDWIDVPVDNVPKWLESRRKVLVEERGECRRTPVFPIKSIVRDVDCYCYRIVPQYIPGIPMSVFNGNDRELIVPCDIADRARLHALNWVNDSRGLILRLPKNTGYPEVICRGSDHEKIRRFEENRYAVLKSIEPIHTPS